MGIFNIKSLKDKYTWGSSEDKTSSAETAEEQQATAASLTENIADGVRSLIKSSPELAGKNRHGIASRTISPDNSLLEAVDDYEAYTATRTPQQEVTPKEELSADGTATISQPLTHTDIEAAPADILDVDAKPTGPSIIRVGQHNPPTVDAKELANPEEANSQNAQLPARLLRLAANAPPSSSSPPRLSTLPTASAKTAPSKRSSYAPVTLPAAHPVR